MNEAMDHEIGRVFDSLTVYNLWSNTDIIFIGDNGDDSRVAQSSPAKGGVYQGGLQVPMIISGPSVKSPNRTRDALSSHN
jgi:arylsulfatase A-like enzyme